MKSTIKRWAETTTFHGIGHYLSGTTKLAKVFWFLLLVLSFGILGISLSSELRQFLDIKEKWKTRISIVRKEFPTLPKLVICNFNRIRLSQANKFNMSNDMLTTLFMNDYNSYQRPLYTEDVSRETKEKLTNWRRSHNFTIKDVYNIMGPQCNETFVKLILRQRFVSYTGSKICDQTKKKYFEVTTMHNSEIGKCFQIQFGPGDRYELSGPLANRVSIILDPQLEEYLHLSDNNYGDVGFALQVSPHGSANAGHWLAVSPGYHIFLGVQTVIERTENTWLFPRRCIHHPRLVYRPKYLYSMDECDFDCYYIPLVNICNCFPLHTARDVRACKQEELDSCLDKLHKRYHADPMDSSTFTEWLADPDYVNCKKTCLPECHESSFDTTVTQTRLSEHQQFMEFGKANLVAIDVYYRTKNIQIIEWYQQMSPSQLLSNIGGLMGLWVGASVITIIHTVTSLLFPCFRNKPRKILESSTKL